MEICRLLAVIGLTLDIIGAGIIVWRFATRYFCSLFSKKVRKDIETEAISVAYARLGSEKQEEMLCDPYVRGFISTYKSSS